MERGAETARNFWRTAAPDCAPEGTADAPGETVAAPETVLDRNLCSESIEFAPGIDCPPDYKVGPPAGGPDGAPAGNHPENASLNSLQNLVLETNRIYFLILRRKNKTFYFQIHVFITLKIDYF